jgi:tripartite-type tricarboxylate transporter receptor subunit TctC
MTLTKTATLGCFALVGLCGFEASPQTLKPLKFVVAAPAGGTSDAVARLLLEQVARVQGITTVVENRPGASTAIGTEAVARATPDGATLLMVTPAFLINAHLRKLNYDPLTSFEPICSLARTAQLIVVNSASPYRTLGDLVGAARTRPDLTMAGAGPASSVHVGFEKLRRAAGVAMTFVPYPGDAPAINAGLGNQVTAVFAPYSGVAEQLKASKLRALAVAARERIDFLPDVPTASESGYDIDADRWQGVVAPAHTSKEATTRLIGWFNTALQTPEIRTRLGRLGLIPDGTCGAQFDAMLRVKYAEIGQILREANVKLE